MRHTTRKCDKTKNALTTIFIRKGILRTKGTNSHSLAYEVQGHRTSLISLGVIAVEKLISMSAYTSLRKLLCKLKQHMGNYVLMDWVI